MNVAWKLKEIVLSEFSPSKKVKVTVTNACPPDGMKCTDRIYEYEKGLRRYMEL